MIHSSPVASSLVATCALVLGLLAGCHRGEKDEVKGSPEFIYKSAKQDLDNSNWQAAVQKYAQAKRNAPRSA